MLNISEKLIAGKKFLKQGKFSDAEIHFQKALDLDPGLMEARFQLGNLLYLRESVVEAIKHYKYILQQTPDLAPVLLNLGHAYRKLNRYDEAEACYNKISAIDPGHREALFSQAEISLDQGRIEQAILQFLQFTRFFPDFIEGHFKLGIAYREARQLHNALASFRAALKINPQLPHIYNHIGIVYKAKGAFSQAEKSYQKALSIDFRLHDVQNNLGTLYMKTGRIEEAVDCFNKALELKPDNKEACFNLGVLHNKCENFDKALHYYQKVIRLDPHNASAYNNVGLLFLKRWEIDEAAKYFKNALRIDPDNTGACFNLGTLHFRCENFDKAFHYYQKVIRIGQHNAQVYNSLGLVFQKHQRIDEAIKCFEQALKIDPDYVDAFCHLFHQLQRVCDWNRLSRMSGEFDKRTEVELTKPKKTSETPFQNITRHDNPALNLAVAKSWSEELSRPISKAGIKFPFDDSRCKKHKITIGYLSNNYGNHPVSHLMQYLFGLHDRNSFNVFCYSYGKDDGSHYRKTIAQDCDKFVDLFDLSYLDSARYIHEDQVDILVDLVGHTENNRMGISAYRPAPVQVSYLGFLASTGADFIDYIITDKIVTPEEHARYYTEKLIYMPHTYQINNNVISDSKIQIKKSDFKLPENSFIFCSFNNPYKIEPQIFGTWMKILKRTDNSILWLYSGGKIAERNLKDQAKARTVDPDRLIFASMIPLENHLARLKLADLALDTRIYNGGATTSNALWAGIPVITILGAHFVSRMTASSLEAIGLPELITHNLKEYETLAVRLAKNTEELNSIKRKLKKNRLTTPLFDTQGFARSLETAYKQIWEIYLSNQKPRQIAVQNHTNFQI